MSESTNRDLVRAYELIEADRNDEARVILDTYLATNKDNPDAWWLYVYAVNNPQDAERALNNVLRLNPNYPGAKELLDETREAAKLQPAGATTTTVATPSSGGIARLGSKPAAQPTPDFLDRLEDDDDDDLDLDSFADDDDNDDLDLDDDFDDGDEVEVEGERRTPNRMVLFGGIGIVALLVIAAIAGVILTNTQRGNKTATPTTIAGGQTLDAPTPTVVFNVGGTSEPDTTEAAPEETAVATEEATEAATSDVQPGSDDFSSVYEALASVDVVEGSAGIESTSAGQTFLVSVCSGAGRTQLSESLTTVMPLVAGQGDTLGAQAEAIGVRLLDCANGNTVLRTVYVTSADAQEFAAGTITADELRRRLKSL